MYSCTLPPGKRYAANLTGMGLENAAQFNKEHKISPTELFSERRDLVVRKLNEYQSNLRVRSEGADRGKENENNTHSEEIDFSKSAADFIRGNNAVYILRPEGE